MLTFTFLLSRNSEHVYLRLGLSLSAESPTVDLFLDAGVCMVIWLVPILLLCQSWKYDCQDSSLCVCIPASKRNIGKEVIVHCWNVDKGSYLLYLAVLCPTAIRYPSTDTQDSLCGLVLCSSPCSSHPSLYVALERLTNLMQGMFSSHRDSGCVT